jgi:hypothetical protein
MSSETKTINYKGTNYIIEFKKGTAWIFRPETVDKLGKTSLQNIHVPINSMDEAVQFAYEMLDSNPSIGLEET